MIKYYESRGKMKCLLLDTMGVMKRRIREKVVLILIRFFGSFLLDKQFFISLFSLINRGLSNNKL